MVFGQSSNLFGQSNSHQANSLFSFPNNSLPSGGSPSMGQNTPFQGYDTYFGPKSGVSQQTQSAFVNHVFGPTANTTTSGVAGTVPPFGMTSAVFGTPSTSVFGPSSSTAFTPGQLSEPSRISPFRSFGSPICTPPSTTFPFGHSSSPAFTPGHISQPSTNFPFGHSSSPALTPGQISQSQPSTNFPFGHSSSPAFTPVQLSQPSTNFPLSSLALTPMFTPPSTAFPFGPSSSPAFTQPSTNLPFGPSSSPAFTQPSTNLPFGPSSSPAFTQPSTNLPFGPSQPSRTSPFGPSSSPAFTPGQLSQPSSTTPFGPLSSPAFPTGQQSQPSMTSPFGPSGGQLSQPLATFPFEPSSSSAFTTNQSPFHTMAVPSVGQTMRSPNGDSGFVQSTVSGMHGGTRVAAYARTSHTDNSSTQAGWLTSISAMPTYREKSHEELKWEDYQIKDKDKGVNSPMQNTSLNNPFSTIPSNIFTANSTIPGSQNSSLRPAFVFPPTNSSPAFVPFSTNSTISQPLSNPAFVPFSTNSKVSQPLSSSPFVPFSTGSTASPAFVPFSTNSGFLNNQTCTPSLTPATFPNSNICTVPSTEVARNSVPSSQPLCPTCNQANPGQPAPFAVNFIQPTQNGEMSEAIPKTSSAPDSFETLARVANQNIFSQVSAAPVTEEKQASHVISPFETLIAAVPQLSFDRFHSVSPIQHGISSMPVTNKPSSVKISTLMTTRHLSQGRIKLPVRKYNPKTDGQKVPFFSEEELPRPPNADAYFNPRDNPRSWIAVTKSKADKSLPVDNGINSVNDIGNTDNSIDEHVGNLISRLNIAHDGEYDVEYTSIELTNRESSDTLVAQEQDTDVESLMPKLQNSEYYTEPSIKNLAAMEKAEPGFCSRVKDFVVGNHTYGYIKFPGETDVRNLDLESTIQFNNREVIVYKDDTKRPPVGQGLNKFAEVTLLNVTCLDKKTGTPCMDEAKIDKYKALLAKKAKEQGAEFLSFNPARGEWKFSVPHFG